MIARLSVVWFLYLAAIGVFMPFYSLYLNENAGLSGSRAGAVYALFPLVGMLAQPLWGQLADRTGSRTRVLACLTAGAGTGYLALAHCSGFVQLLLGTAGLALFSTAVVPLCTSVSLGTLRDSGRHSFGIVRTFGTLGFFATVVAFPRLLHHVQATHSLETTPGGPSEPGLEMMFLISAVLTAAAALAALALPQRGAVALRAGRGDWRPLLRHGPFLRGLLFALLAYLFLHGPMMLFPIYVRAHGGTLDDVSSMWVLMLVIETPLIALSGTLSARLGARGALAMGVFCGGARWLACSLVSDLNTIFWIQALHGAVVAGLLVGGPLYIEATVPEALRSTGQGFLAMVSIGGGGFISILCSGVLIEHFGADAPYLIGGGGALALVCLVPWLLPKPRRPGGVSSVLPL